MRKLTCIIVLAACTCVFAGPVWATEYIVAGSGATFRQNTKGAKVVRIALAGFPDAIFTHAVVVPGGATAYVTYRLPSIDQHGVAVVDLRVNVITRQVLTTGQNPRKLTLDVDTNRLFVPHQNGVDVFDTTAPTSLTLAYTANITGRGASFAEHALVSADGTTLYVGTSSGHVLYYTLLYANGVQTGAAFKASTSITGATFLLESLDATKVFVCMIGPYDWLDPNGEFRSGNIAVLNANADASAIPPRPLAIIGIIAAGTGEISFGVMAGARLYAPSNDGSLFSVDPISEQVLDEKVLGGRLTGITYAADGKLYVCDGATATIRTISVAGIPTSDVIGKSLALPQNASPYGIAELVVKRGRK